MGCQKPESHVIVEGDVPLGPPRPIEGEFATGTTQPETAILANGTRIRQPFILVNFTMADGTLVEYATIHGLTMRQIHDRELFPMDGGRRVRIFYDPDQPQDCWVDEILIDDLD